MEKSIKTKEYQALIKFLTDIRNENSITQHMLAEIIDEPQSLISKYERLERKLDVKEYFDICKSMGLSDEETALHIVETRKKFID